AVRDGAAIRWRLPGSEERSQRLGEQRQLGRVPAGEQSRDASLGAGLSNSVRESDRDDHKVGADRAWEEISPRELIRERHLPDVALVTQQRETVHFYRDLVGDKKVIITFMYTRCEGTCIPVTANLVQVQRLLGDRVGRDVFFYSITLKPEEDTPDALANYAA